MDKINKDNKKRAKKRQKGNKTIIVMIILRSKIFKSFEGDCTYLKQVSDYASYFAVEKSQLFFWENLEKYKWRMNAHLSIDILTENTTVIFNTTHVYIFVSCSIYPKSPLSMKYKVRTIK